MRSSCTARRSRCRAPPTQRRKMRSCAIRILPSHCTGSRSSWCSSRPIWDLRSACRSPARRATTIFIWHKSVGVVILIAALVRLAYRWKNPPPPFPPELPAWERVAAVWNHRLFYALLIAMPIVGFVAVSGFANGPTTPLVGGHSRFRSFRASAKRPASLPAKCTRFAAFLLVGLILLHIGGGAEAPVHRQAGGARRGCRRSPRTASRWLSVRARARLAEKAEHRKRHAPRHRRRHEVSGRAVAVPDQSGGEAR